jgi:transcription initiation factor TFIIF subunit beta
MITPFLFALKSDPYSLLPQISLRLNDHPNNKDIPKDYLLQRQNVDSKNSSFTVQNNYIFSEKDLPGHKNRVDEIFGETRSMLYESMKREARKKTFKKKWEPYVRKTIPSMFILLSTTFTLFFLWRR